MRHLLPPATLCVSALFCLPAHAGLQPADVVSGFYMARLSGAEAGTPNGFQLARYSAFLSPKLVCMLGTSLRYEEHFSQQHPGEPSPFPIDLYSGRNVIPASFTLDKFKQSGGHATATISLMTRPNADQSSTTWSNTVNLEIVRHHWLITDIDYTVDQEHPATLIGTLNDVLHKAPAVDGWSIKELDSCVIERPPAKSRSSKHHHSTKSRHTTRHTARHSNHTTKKSVSHSKSTSRKTTQHSAKHTTSTKSKKTTHTAKSKAHTKKK